MQTISSKGLDHIKVFEGLRLKAYQDSVGIWTIGYGHTGPDVHPGLSISEQKATDLLLEDVGKAEKLVRQYVKVDLTQGQFDAVTSLVFNIGPGGRAKSGIFTLNTGQPSTFLRRLNSEDPIGAGLAIKDWVYAGGKKLAGLVRRRDAEYTLFMG